MYKSFLDALDKAGIVLPRWFFIVVAVIFTLLLIWYLLKKYIIPTLKKMNDVYNDVKSIKDIRETQVESINKSIEGDKKLQEQITGINGYLDKIIVTLEEMQQKTDQQELHKLKDRIRQSYAYYHEKGEINAMELESLEGLIEAYEAIPGGNNSFVHSIVQKEMYTWKRV